MLATLIIYCHAIQWVKSLIKIILLRSLPKTTQVLSVLNNTATEAHWGMLETVILVDTV